MKFQAGSSDMASAAASIFIILMTELSQSHPEIKDEETLEILISINGISVDFRTVFERYDALIQESLAETMQEHSKAIKRLATIKELLESDDES